MRVVSIVALLLCLKGFALAHPGKTDRMGGHRCWKGCDMWELAHGEYHLHDKDFKPVSTRSEQDDASESPATEEPVGPEDGVALQEPKAEVPAPVSDLSKSGRLHEASGTEMPSPKGGEAHVVTVGAGILSSGALLLILLFLFILLALVIARRRGRKRECGRRTG